MPSSRAWCDRPDNAADQGIGPEIGERSAGIAGGGLQFQQFGQHQLFAILPDHAPERGGELLWTSAAHVVIVTRDGRIVRTLGLGHDLSGLTARNNIAPPPPAAAIRASFASTRLEDFPELNFYGVLVSCRAQLAGRQSIKVLGQAIATFRVDETCNSGKPEWSFTDSFWVDADNGLVWRSRQHIHPRGGT